MLLDSRLLLTVVGLLTDIIYQLVHVPEFCDL
jgi:hypothetical protein